jgi:7-cyano-7-deazaguanine synthase in queuosine biosynthesis
MSQVRCKVRGVRENLPTREADFDLGPEPMWSVQGQLGSAQLSDRALDLLDLAGAIYRIESQIRRRATDPAIEWVVTAPVRDAVFWNSTGGLLLASTLSFLNRALWKFRFTQRRGAPAIVLPGLSQNPIEEVILFSGGMDSLCGAGSHAAPHRARLVSFYHSQSGLQAELAAELGFAPPTQWRLGGRRGREGMNLIRSFMFLVLAAVVAASHRARKIYQYENGVLAVAVPQSGNFIPTRHAHPETHRRMTKLLNAVFDADFEIVNPFLELTKREVGIRLVRAIGEQHAEKLLRRTETCWYLMQPRIGGEKKHVRQPCGVCTPCIVRLTARPNELTDWKWGKSKKPGYAYDLRKARVRNKERLGLTFRAYLELVEIVTGAADDQSLVDELAPEARMVIDNLLGPDEALVAGLMRRFAGEFCNTFEIRIPEKSTA